LQLGETSWFDLTANMLEEAVGRKQLSSPQDFLQQVLSFVAHPTKACGRPSLEGLNDGPRVELRCEEARQFTGRRKLILGGIVG